jgi:uncharacterized protein (DUF952 family)
VIFYVMARSAWEQAERLETKVTSRDFGEPFVHCCDHRQIQYVRNAYFPADEAIVALALDPTRLSGETRYELGSGAESDRFPHVYGSIHASDVVEIISVSDEPL